LEGKGVLPVEERVLKLKAAQRARENPDFVLIARTGAREPLGLEETIAQIEAAWEELFRQHPHVCRHDFAVEYLRSGEAEQEAGRGATDAGRLGSAGPQRAGVGEGTAAACSAR
jgi:hypothetical protein